MGEPTAAATTRADIYGDDRGYSGVEGSGDTRRTRVASTCALAVQTGIVAHVESGVERDLATYYDQEVGDRLSREPDPERVAARERFIESLDDLARVRLLEIGTGVGRDAAAFIGHGILTYGVDLSYEQSGQALDKGVRQVMGTVRRLPFRDHAFDVVWTMSVLMHVPNRQIDTALGEIARVLRRGGLAVIGVWGGEDCEQPRLEEDYEPPRLFSRRSDESWRAHLARIGDVEEFRTWGESRSNWYYQWAQVRRNA